MLTDMRFRIWHLMLAMVVLAISLPMAKWLLALEAMDHLNKPQTVLDFLGFYIGSAVFVALPIALVVTLLRHRS